MYRQPVNRSSYSNDDIVMDTNPAYEERTTNENVKANKDTEYETVDLQCGQNNTDNTKMDPAYAETKLYY